MRIALLTLIALAACIAIPAAAQDRAIVAADAPLESADRAQVIDRLAQALATKYVIPEEGLRLAVRIRERSAAGAYANIRDRRQLAESLSKDLASLRRDARLWVRYFAPMPSGGGALDDTWLNYGFPDVRILD